MHILTTIMPITITITNAMAQPSLVAVPVTPLLPTPVPGDEGDKRCP